jgi:hydrogenase expression/formation protein HypC
MKVLEVNGNVGIVEAGGVQKTADLSLTDAVEKGDYVIVHAGFAIQTMNEEEALKTLSFFDEMIRLMEQEKI